MGTADLSVTPPELGRVVERPGDELVSVDFEQCVAPDASVSEATFDMLAWEVEVESCASVPHGAGGWLVPVLPGECLHEVVVYEVPADEAVTAVTFTGTDGFDTPGARWEVSGDGPVNADYVTALDEAGLDVVADRAFLSDRHATRHLDGVCEESATRREEYLDEMLLTAAAGNVQPHLAWATLQYCSDGEINAAPPATRTYPDLDGDPVTFIELGNWRDGAPNWAVRLDHVLEREGCGVLQLQYNTSMLPAEDNWGIPPNEVEARYALDIGGQAGCDWAAENP